MKVAAASDCVVFVLRGTFTVGLLSPELTLANRYVTVDFTAVLEGFSGRPVGIASRHGGMLCCPTGGECCTKYRGVLFV